MNDPIFALALSALNFAGREIDCHAAVERVVIHEVAFNDLAFVTESDEEFFESIVSIVLHYVPEDWVAAHLDHRLWFHFGLFDQPRTEAAGQDHNLHLFCPSVVFAKSRIQSASAEGAQYDSQGQARSASPLVRNNKIRKSTESAEYRRYYSASFRATNHLHVYPGATRFALAPGYHIPRLRRSPIG